MQHLAKLVQGQGRGNDTLLVHMTPREVGGLQALATAHGGSLTVNPKTGLPEAGFLDSILPMLGGALGGALTDIPPWMIGLGAAGVQTAITGDLGAGLMAGLGAFGGASIGSAFGPDVGLNQQFKTGLGPGVTGSAIPSSGGGDTSYDGYLEGASPSAATGAVKAATPTAADPLGRLVSASRMGLDPQGSFAKMAPWAAGLGVLSPLLGGGLDGSSQTYNPDTSGVKKWNYNGPYKPAPRRIAVDPRHPGDSSEALYFDKVNPYPGFVGAASGGLVALAGGGSPDVSHYAADFASKFANGNFGDGADSSEQLYNFARPTPVVPVSKGVPSTGPIQGSAAPSGLGALSGAAGLGDIYTGSSGGGGYGGVGQGTADISPDFMQNFNPYTYEQNYGFSYPSQIPNGPSFDYQIHANDPSWGTSLPSSQLPNISMPYGGFMSGLDDPNGIARTVAGIGSWLLPAGLSLIPGGFMGIYDTLTGQAPPNTSAETLGGKLVKSFDPSDPTWAEPGIYDLLHGTWSPSGGGGGGGSNSGFDLGSVGLAGYPSAFGYFGLGGNLSPLNTGDMGGAFGFSNFGGASNFSGWGEATTADNNGGHGQASGGEDLRDGSFVVDARTVAEFGNGSSRAGQELLSRIGGQPINGPGDGVSDSIQANINNGQEEARVARDEVKFSPEAVAQLGGGDADKGAKYLYSLMAKAKAARKKADHGQDTGLRALVGVK